MPYLVILYHAMTNLDLALHALPRHASLPALGIGDGGFEISGARIGKTEQNRSPAKLQLTNGGQELVQRKAPE